jgi:hypothetical protein
MGKEIIRYEIRYAKNVDECAKYEGYIYNMKSVFFSP